MICNSTEAFLCYFLTAILGVSSRGDSDDEVNFLTGLGPCEPHGRALSNGSCVCFTDWVGDDCDEILCYNGRSTYNLVQSEPGGAWVHGPWCDCDLLFDGRHCKHRNWWLLIYNDLLDKLVMVTLAAFVFIAGAVFIGVIMTGYRAKLEREQHLLAVEQTFNYLVDASVQTDLSLTTLLAPPEVTATCRVYKNNAAIV